MRRCAAKEVVSYANTTPWSFVLARSKSGWVHHTLREQVERCWTVTWWRKGGSEKTVHVAVEPPVHEYMH